eukprot:5746830-Alexandrium_andersonii.AAC.1
MSASLVGSEMCIRDKSRTGPGKQRPGEPEAVPPLRLRKRPGSGLRWRPGNFGSWSMPLRALGRGS